MPLDVIMPALGMAQESGQIIAWHKKPGDQVAEGDVLFEVETDKATMEVEAAGAGFLTNVTAGEGDDVPVGDVIARISKTVEDAETLPAPSPPAADDGKEIPKGHEVIMPTLGMAQDSGLLVKWAVSPGDKVAEGDILFEVETDKATQEVEVQKGGYVAALLAQEGEDVPTGQVIAILTDTAPTNPISRSATESSSTNATGTARQPEGGASPADTFERPDASQPRRPSEVEIRDCGTGGGRVLASPKLRRIAVERGLDLGHLAKAGVPQPYHMRDLDQLEELARGTPTTAVGAAPPPARRLVAEVPGGAFEDFATWLAEAEVPEAAALATFAAAALGALPATVAVEGPGGSTPVLVASERLTATQPSDRSPDLVIRDLRSTSLTEIDLGPEDVPVVTLMHTGSTLTLTLECSGASLSGADAVAALSGLAARLEEPLRHLL